MCILHLVPWGRVVPPIFISAVVAACGGSGGADAGWVVRDSAGIVIVENDHTLPAWRDGRGWRLSAEPAVRIGTVSGDTTQQLYRVVHSRILSDGRIAVVNSGTSEVRLYDGEGRYLMSLGGSGDGPGEFRSPWAVHEVAADSILVIDLYREISVFDSDGRYARRFVPERPEGRVQGEGFEPVDQFGDGSLLFRSHHRQDPTWVGVHRNQISMVRTLLDGSFGGSLGDFDDQTVMYGGLGQYVFGARAREGASDTTMWYGPGDRFEIREVAFDGRTVRLIRLDQPPRPVTGADEAEFRDATLERVRGTSQEPLYNRLLAGSEFAENFPAHYDVWTDAAGNLWVQDYQPYTARVDRMWSVFDSRGRYLGEVTVPAGLTVHDIGEDYVLGRWTDDLDVEYIVKYDLEKGTN